MVMLDTNMILRYLLNDNEEMAERTEKYLCAGNVMVTTEVIAEVVYVLLVVYRLEREKIAGTVEGFLKMVSAGDKEVLNLAVVTFGSRNLDFVDCVLYAYHKLRGIEVATFDKKLLKLMEQDQRYDSVRAE